MTNFFTENRDPIPPLVSPIYQSQFFHGKSGSNTPPGEPLTRESRFFVVVENVMLDQPMDKVFSDGIETRTYESQQLCF